MTKKRAQMKKTLYVFCASFVVCSIGILAQPPKNLTLGKQDVILYYESGEFEKEVENLILNAESYLQKRIKENTRLDQPRPFAIILDIDDTSITNFPFYKKTNFRRNKSLMETSFQEARAPAIRPTLRLFNEAIQHHVKVFFVSFRPKNRERKTIQNLHYAGYWGWNGLILHDQNEKKRSVKDFKLFMRKKLIQQGYDIILNIGDQDNDLDGGYAERTVKIPNPLYLSRN